MVNRVLAILLIVVFVAGMTCVYIGFFQGNNDMGAYGLGAAIMAGLGSFLLKKRVNQEAGERKARPESPVEPRPGAGGGEKDAPGKAADGKEDK